MPLTIERVPAAALSDPVLDEVRAVCRDAYGEDMTPYFADIGPGVHLLGRRDRTLVAHAMWVDRALYPASRAPLDAAYVELVATRVAHQRQGYATRLMRRLAEEIRRYAIGALSPAVTPFYERLGWEMWRGPLFVRTPAGTEATPDERIMVLRLPRTPADLDLGAPLAVDWRPGEVW